MALFSVTTITGLILLLYLSSFVLFAIIRVTTGVSIQRVGYLSLRRIAFTPKEGVRAELHALRISLHRPTVARPTWFSLRLEGLKISWSPLPLNENSNATDLTAGENESQSGEPANSGVAQERLAPGPRRHRSHLWKRLTALKETLKRIHTHLHWLKLLDVVAVETVFEVVNVANIQIAHFSATVDTRREMVDRGRLFRHKKDPSGDQRRAEWIFTTKSVFLTVVGRAASEVLDSMSLNIHGILYKERAGLRDTSIALKSDRLHIPCDDLLAISSLVESSSTTGKESAFRSPVKEVSFADLVEELDSPGSREEAIVQTVADSKEFISSMLSGVQEFQLALSFIRLSREIGSTLGVTAPLTLNMVTHEIGIDLHRLDQTSPAHRMYFPRSDVAHQALIAAISISVSIDAAERSSSKIMYIPMATATIKTTLPSKTVRLANDEDVNERNANMLFANLVITSPSVDLGPDQLSQLLSMERSRGKTSSKKQRESHRLISRLLPKASVKLSVHEPVVRFLLPSHTATPANRDEYDLIISAVSSISLDVESSYSTIGELRYSLDSIFRISSHQLYYQTSSGLRHNLLVTEALELKVRLTATREVQVAVDGNLKQFSIQMTREEVSAGIYNIVKHFDEVAPYAELPRAPEAGLPSFLRRLPSWLVEVHLEGSDFSVEMGGVDREVSNQARGFSMELESWTAHYQSQPVGPERRPSTPRRRSIAAFRSERPGRISTSSWKKDISTGDLDGRELSVKISGLEGFILESCDVWETEPFLRLPLFEIAFRTSRDMQGPILRISSAIHALYLYVSLYRLYSIGVAVMALKDAFQGPVTASRSTHSSPATIPDPPGVTSMSQSSHKSNTELVTMDVQMSFLQVKATLPADPPMLLQVYDVAAGHHRWSAPFLRCHLLRLHAESPKLKNVWARLISVSSIRIDMRQSRKKSGTAYMTERSVDIATDFIRLSVPHGLTMYRVFDNVINTVKSVEQLQHRFKTRDSDFVLEKKPAKPKEMPKVSIRSKALMFEIEDDPFEWKLGMIYRVGLLEQRQRMARAAAFRTKVKKMKEDHHPRATSRHASQTAQPQTQSSGFKEERGRSQSQGSRRPVEGRSRGRGRYSTSQIRYDPDGVSGLTGSATVSVQQAWEKLQAHHSRAWKRRIDSVLRPQPKTLRNIRRMFSEADEPPHDVEEGEVILAVPDRPGLMSTVISDLYLVLDKPDFPLSECAKFLHEVGKGMPLDMQYSLMIPMKMSLDMGEARVMLRNYPLDLLHIPTVKPGQPPKLASWSLRSDFIIAEEFRDARSMRDRKVDIVLPHHQSDHNQATPGYSLYVRRTVSPVKTYSKVFIDINTSLPTTISWGTSHQPVIQDMMMVIESFTKPEVDPSDRIGFWDKIRLNFHSRLTMNWKCNGDVHLRLKGSRDPYAVTGYGAGFVMCWRGNVQWTIHTTDDAREFMIVKSDEYMLAIPDYSNHAHHAAEYGNREDDLPGANSQKDPATFQKVIMKVSGNVRWVAGLMFERNSENEMRTFEFKPHYTVALQNPQSLDKVRLKDYDAYRGFRSHHIHLSLTVSAPYNRNWSYSNLKASNSYNTVHLSPRFFSHFFDWWSLFSGVMSLPIRQGKVWCGPEKTSKKFGRHLASFKYKLLLSPLFIAHIYKHRDGEDHGEETVSATGLKLRLDSFLLDLHQRREWFDTIGKGKSKQTRTSGMRIHEGQLDFVNADLRAVSASIAGTDVNDLLRANDEALPTRQRSHFPIDMSRFTIPDRDTSWIDMDDFVELGWVLPIDSNPETQILPLAFTRRFTYFRQTDHGTAIHGDESRSSPFGKEPTHYCAMSRDHDPRQVQMDLVRERISSITKQIDSHTRLIGEQELQVIRDGHEDVGLRQRHELLVQQGKELLAKHDFLLAGLARLTDQTSRTDGSDTRENIGKERSQSNSSNHSMAEGRAYDGLDYLFHSFHEDPAKDFDNRFTIHNVQFKWNNLLRNIILRYSHQVSQRRGFVYYMSRRAVKFILDIVSEQTRSKAQATPPSQSSGQEHHSGTETEDTPGDDQDDVESRIDGLLKDAERFVDADDVEGDPKRDDPGASNDGSENQLAADFVSQNSYHVRLIAPQIQLQSEKNSGAVAIVSAREMQLSVVAIMDKARISDDVSGLVQRQFSLGMDGAQFFVSTQKMLCKFLHLYSGDKYGNSPDSSWPPWVSLEAIFDFELHPFGFERVIQRTSATLRYEKYNTLRLKYNEEVARRREPGRGSHRAESRMDHLAVNFPRIRAQCDSSQYYALYIIVLDLLLYSEPREKVRSERLEKIMLASDLNDLRGAPEMATSLQLRLRQLEEIKSQFLVNARYLDRQGWQDRLNLEADLASCEDELFFIMKAITTSQSQRKNDDREAAQTQGLLQWHLTASEVVWHLMRAENEPLLEFQLRDAAYERIDNSDGSNHNAMEIGMIYGVNLLAEALYPEMIGPYHESPVKTSQQNQDRKMIKVRWHMLEAIAGIPVLEQFQVTLFPLKIQLDRDLGKKLFEYIFPGAQWNSSDGNLSPFMIRHMPSLDDQEDDEASEAAKMLIPEMSGSRPLQDSLISMSETASIHRRMKPTLRPSNNEPPPPTNPKLKGLGFSTDRSHLSLLRHGSSAASSKGGTNGLFSRKLSVDSFALSSKPLADRSPTVPSPMNHDESRRKFGLPRSSSKERKDKEGKGPSDELSQMMARANNYMTLAHVKLDSVVICLSYKGKGDRNLEDLHDFVFRMPILEYRNKTWSNLDLALRLKKDFVRALISHAGAIIGHKFHSRPSKQQLSRLREATRSSQVLSHPDFGGNTPSNSDTGSMVSFNPYAERSVSPRRSFVSTNRRSSPPAVTESFPSSVPSSKASSLRLSTRDSSDRSRDPMRSNLHLRMTPLARRFSVDGSNRGRQARQGNDEEGDHDNTRKKAVGLLRKKILGSLS